MKLKNILYYLAVIVLLTSQLWANTNPVVTNVKFSITGTTVTVHYDVTDAEESSVTISMEVSSDGGATWNYNFGATTGDIGASIPVGINKTFTWTYSGVQNSNFKIKIIADDIVGDQIYYAGKTYNTVTIGSQVWLKENLDVGTRLDGTVAQTDNSTIEKYCLNNDLANCTTYGGLYQWAEAVAYTNGATNTSSPSPAFTGNVQGICPSGWHIPTEAEYETLGSTVSNNSNALKAVGQGTGGGAGTNTSGFSALLAGDYSNGSFFGNYAFFWTSTQYDVTNTYAPWLYFNTSTINLGYRSSKAYGFSVRCVKN